MGNMKNFVLFFIFLSKLIFPCECEDVPVNNDAIVPDGYCDGDNCKDENHDADVNMKQLATADTGDDMNGNGANVQPQNSAINIMITFYNAVRNEKLKKAFTTTVNSILEHASVPLNIHIIGDEESQNLAAKIIADNPKGNKNYKMVTLDVDKLAVELQEVIEPMQKHFSYKPGAYYNHALFFLSIAMHRVMPHLSKVIMLDADLKFTDDIKKLHDRFRLFTKDNIIGIGRDLQPVYRHTFWKYRQDHPGTRVGNPPPDGLTGFNSGVLLLDLDKMRNSSLYNVLLSSDKLESLTKEFHFKGHLGDQDFFSLLSMKYEWLFHVLPCQWNRQLCTWWKDHGYKDIFDQYFTCEGDIKIWHGNCGTPIPE